MNFCATMAATLQSLLLLSLLLAFHYMMSEAALCQVPSTLFSGLCFSDQNCATICEKEGFLNGNCNIFKCICSKDCNVSANSGNSGQGSPGEGPPGGGSPGDEKPPAEGPPESEEPPAEGPPGDEEPPTKGPPGGKEPPAEGPPGHVEPPAEGPTEGEKPRGVHRKLLP